MSLTDALLYVVSLPERTLRSVAAGIGGVSKLATDSLLPSSLRGTKFYTFLLGNTQRFIIEGIGNVEGAYAKDSGALPENYVAKKVVGNVVDAAGMFAFHFSPVWFFALVGDAASGTKVYLNRVVDELKKDGAISPDATIGTAGDLLDALNTASSKTTLPLDTPPLSKAELTALGTEIAAGYAQLYRSGSAAIPSPEALWQTFTKLRDAEKVPLLRLSGAMALSSAKAVGVATGTLMWETTVRSYAASLDAVSKRGFAAFFAEASAPYFEALAGAFAPARKTLTEKLLSGELFRRAPPAK